MGHSSPLSRSNLREPDALARLQNENVEAVDGLNDRYVPQSRDSPSQVGIVGEVLIYDAKHSAAQNSADVLGTNKVFEAGFCPLANGSKLDLTIDFKQNAAACQLFDFWFEALPTDQFVAVDYNPNATKRLMTCRSYRRKRPSPL